MTDLTEASLLEFRKALRAEPISFKPSQLIVFQEGLDHMKALCAADPEYRKRVLAEFPQFEGIL